MGTFAAYAKNITETEGRRVLEGVFINRRYVNTGKAKWPSRLERGISHQPGEWGRTGYSAACNLGS